jgi:pimeloyl-ACP methyl ester carboxylesterase
MRRVKGKLALVGAGIGVAAAARAMLRAERAWAKAEDPTGGEPLGFPEVEESVVRTDDGAELAVAVAGAANDGPTVVLVHCWMGDRRVWGTVARQLATGHKVVLYDHRGHGRSTRGSAPLDLDTLASDLRTVLEHVDARDAVVAGHSMGGMTTQAFAIRYPEVRRERVAGIVLVATACDGLRETAPPAPPGAIGHPVADVLFGRPRIGRLLVRNSVGEVCVAGHLDALVETILGTPPTVRAGFLRSMRDMDLRAGLADVDVPAVVISGTKDQVTRPGLSQRIAEALPGARLVVLPGMGHMLPWEAPDVVARTIAEVAAAAPTVQAPAV